MPPWPPLPLYVARHRAPPPPLPEHTNTLNAHHRTHRCQKPEPKVRKHAKPRHALDGFPSGGLAPTCCGRQGPHLRVRTDVRYPGMVPTLHLPLCTRRRRGFRRAPLLGHPRAAPSRHGRHARATSARPSTWRTTRTPPAHARQPTWHTRFTVDRTHSPPRVHGRTPSL